MEAAAPPHPLAFSPCQPAASRQAPEMAPRHALWLALPPASVVLLSAALLACGKARAQQTTRSLGSASGLPSASGNANASANASASGNAIDNPPDPLPDAPGLPAPAPAPAANPASITGTVLDINGGMVPGARLTLTDPTQGFEQSMVADSEGHFAFDGLSPGTYTLTIAATDLETYISSPFVLRAGEHREVPRVALPIAHTSADVQVTVTQVALATEQVQAAEQQRVLGLLPNFYSSYIWDAAPLNARQKYSLALHATIDPVAFLGAGFAAGVQQANDAYKGYGQGASGYGKRFGANFADGTIGLVLSAAVLPSLLHQDPRYFYKGSGTTRSRVLYAISTAFICKGDNGRWQPNYSSLLGGLAAGAISNAYYPSSDRGVSLTVENWLLGTAGDMVGGLVREFVMRRLTHKVPTYEQGKP